MTRPLIIAGLSLMPVITFPCFSQAKSLSGERASQSVELIETSLKETPSHTDTILANSFGHKNSSVNINLEGLRNQQQQIQTQVGEWADQQRQQYWADQQRQNQDALQRWIEWQRWEAEWQRSQEEWKEWIESQYGPKPPAEFPIPLEEDYIEATRLMIREMLPEYSHSYPRVIRLSI